MKILIVLVVFDYVIVETVIKKNVNNEGLENL